MCARACVCVWGVREGGEKGRDRETGGGGGGERESPLARCLRLFCCMDDLVDSKTELQTRCTKHDVSN